METKKKEQEYRLFNEKQICKDLMLEDGIFDWVRDMLNKLDMVGDKKLRRALLVQRIVGLIAVIRDEAVNQIIKRGIPKR